MDLADSTGTVQTQYTYDPFGNTTDQGAASGNPYQYNDWQNDGDGSYFDGDSYYSPTFQRYSSQRSVIPRLDWRNPYTYQPTPGGGSAFAPANPYSSPLAGRKPQSYLSRAGPYLAPVALALLFPEGEALEGAAELAEAAEELEAAEAAEDAGIVAQNGTKITGFTGHGINRAIGDAAERAGVKPGALLDALKNPEEVVSGVDEQGRPFQKFIGQNAQVVVNPQTGRVVSVNPLSGAGAQ